MTATPAVPTRSAPTRHWPIAAAARLLRLELRRNAMIGMLPLVAVLFWVLTYRRSMAMPPVWSVRAMSMQGTTIAVFIPTLVGAAAWMGSREARRGMSDLLAGTATPRWHRQLTTWAATTGWAFAAYLCCVGLVYAVTAWQATWGGPLWWPAVVVAASLPALSALGFTAGALRPSRFTPPLVAVAAFLAMEISLQFIHGTDSYWQISPLVAGVWELGTFEGLATFYPYLPDLAIAQLVFLAGVTAALLGVLGVPARAGGRGLRGCAAVITGVGVLVAGGAVALAGTGQFDAHGMLAIPLLHDSADDRPMPYTPVCTPAAIPICFHPAYTAYLPAVAAALEPVLNEVAGLPGSPARISQAATDFRDQNGTSVTRTSENGTPSVYSLFLPNQFPGPSMTIAQAADELRSTVGRNILGTVIGFGPDPAQRAVLAAVLYTTGVDATAPVDGAAQRFAALSGSVRHAWLMEHLTALRAGQLNLAQLP